MNKTKYNDHNKTKKITMTPSQASKIIVKPHITERTFDLVESFARICFIVHKSASKPEIREAVSVLYNIKAVKINTARTIYGKKAFVVLENTEKARDLATDIGML